MTDNQHHHLHFASWAAGFTHAGRVRTRNEDAFHVDEAAGVFAVMDGVGGHHGGDVASGLVRDALRTITQPTNAQDLLDQFEDRVIQAKALMDDVDRGNRHAMGTTIAALLRHGNDYACVWAGDSRVYLLRHGSLHQLTHDHTEVQELLDQNILNAEEAENFAMRHKITRAVGAAVRLELDMETGKLQDGDRFMMCSDGLTGFVSDEDVRATLSFGSAEESAQHLIQAALRAGGEDNVTAVVVDFRVHPGSQAEAHP